jgi:hypothetical protein
VCMVRANLTIKAVVSPRPKHRLPERLPRVSADIVSEQESSGCVLSKLNLAYVCMLFLLHDAFIIGTDNLCMVCLGFMCTALGRGMLCALDRDPLGTRALAVLSLNQTPSQSVRHVDERTRSMDGLIE